MSPYSKWILSNLQLLAEGDKNVLLEQLQTWGLIPREGEYLCPKCSAPLHLYVDVQSAGGWRWLCMNKVSVRKQKRRACGTVVNFYKSTFFERSHITMYQVLGFVHLWVGDVSLKFVRNELRIAAHTVVDWLAFCRDVVFEDMVNRSVKIGGPGVTVEIDESKFGKLKYRRGHPVEGHWVFGGYERGTGRVFMVIVDDRTSNTLLPIIENWIEPGTTIISDCWRAYGRLDEQGYNHLTVNHLINFRDPETGAHTNSIESSWRAAKAVMASGGRTKNNIPGNLARYMFYKQCKQLGEDRYEAFLKLAGKLYNPLIPPRQQFDDGEITEEEISDDE